MGYSSENAIPTHFQRVPPWPVGLYLLFAAIIDGMGPQTKFVHANLNVRACRYASVCTRLNKYEQVQRPEFITPQIHSQFTV